jgi:hypothetical protein
MNVKKRNPVPFRELPARHIVNRTVNAIQPTDGYMPGDDGVRHSRQPPVSQMDVGTANLAQFHAEDCRISL